MLIRVPREAARMLDHLTAGLTDPADAGDGCHRKIDNTGGAFMPVVVENIGGDQYSVAHYGEQNGDAMRDPEMVFWRNDGAWFATYWRNDYAHVETTSVYFENGKPEKFAPKLHVEHTDFAVMWMRNIADQQGIDPAEATPNEAVPLLDALIEDVESGRRIPVVERTSGSGE